MRVAARDVRVRLHRDDVERHFANRAGGKSDGTHTMGETKQIKRIVNFLFFKKKTFDGDEFCDHEIWK